MAYVCQIAIPHLVRRSVYNGGMSQPQFVYRRPAQPSFDKHGATGWVYATQSHHADHLLIECQTDTGYTVALREAECEFNYFVLKGDGEVVVDGVVTACSAGDMIVIPPAHTFTFSGQLTLLLINAPKWSQDQETEMAKSEAYR